MTASNDPSAPPPLPEDTGAAPRAPAPSQPQAITDLPLRPAGSAVARWVLKSFGWTLDFDGLPGRQGVLALYPHTSNWDFVLAMLAKWGIGMPVAFWVKHSLLQVPLLGRWVRWIGGVAVRRDGPQGAVRGMQQQMEDAQREGRFMWLALAPEGTRSLTAGWRSGFYQVATGAGVPLALGHVDYQRKHVGILGFLQLSGDPDADMAAIAEAFANVQPYAPHLAGPVRLLPSAPASPSPPAAQAPKGRGPGPQ
ncbi:MAG: 1-acyl-sn-glycerol-3-phosphate acyltransferase [Rubrivivax sp.]|jgi:1-acyl-sn-glycerol-3-phosphate acyltransferase